jgi:hypothetical protein
MRKVNPFCFSIAEFPIVVIFVNVLLIASEVIADEGINRELLRGNWKLISLFDPQLKSIKTFDGELDNGLIIKEDQLSEKIHNNMNEEPYLMTHKYEISGNCLMVKYPSKEVYWEIIDLDGDSLKVSTPMGELSLRR